MPLFGNRPGTDATTWEPQAADSRLAQTAGAWGAHATEFLATGTANRRLSAEHRLPDTSPRPTFTLGLDT
jgi:hypothetical protein